MERKLRAAFVLCCVAIFFAAGALLCGADARGAYLAGAQAAGVEDYELAIERYREALSLNASYMEPMVGLAQAFLAMEEYDEAFKFVQQALTYDRSNPDIAVLEGRIKIGQGDVPGARALFTKVLDDQPNNIEARLGMAEAEIAEGKQKNALARYQDTLRLAPESTAALLSLAMLSDESGDRGAAGKYYELALRSHASDARVQLASAAWYASIGNYGLAEKHAQIALSLKPGLDRARVLLGGIYLQTARYSNAIATLRDVVSANRDDALAWYSLGLAYRRSGDAAKAITSFASGLQARPDDEVARIAQEGAAVASLAMDDAQRKKMASFHQASGKGFEDRSFLEKALAEYRRALILDPTSRDSRVSYARIYRSFGFPGKYLSELQVLARLGVKDTLVSDEIERLTSGLSESVSSAWGYDQYNIERQRYTIPVYTMAATNRLRHPLASEDLARYFGSLLGRYDTLSVPDAPPLVAGFDEAFRSARGAGTDYFAIVSFDEAERSFSATVDLYLSRTGSRIGSFNAYRTGNDRVRDGFMKIAGQVAGLMQPRGTLLVRKFGQGAIDLGRFQGVNNGDTLVIVRKGGVRLQPDGPGLTYSDDDVVGDFKITATDEAVSEGTVKGRGYFDLVNAGDQVVYPVKRTAPPSVSGTQRAGNILTRLFRIGR